MIKYINRHVVCDGNLEDICERIHDYQKAMSRRDIFVHQVKNHCMNGRITEFQRIGTNRLIPTDCAKQRNTYVCEKENFHSN